MVIILLRFFNIHPIYAGATATDNIDGLVTVSTIGAVDTATVGSYTLTYSASDQAGNTSADTKIVHVIATTDSSAPNTPTLTTTPRSLSEKSNQ